MKNKEIISGLLHDMEDFAVMKGLRCEPIYLLGGSGCILMDYLNRGTTDIDLLDMDYSAGTGRLFRLLENFDMLDIALTSVADDYKKRAVKMDEFQHIEVYVLSREDVIVTKIARYSPKDREDISIMMQQADRALILQLIENVEKREDFSKIAKSHFCKNAALFKEEYYV